MSSASEKLPDWLEAGQRLAHPNSGDDLVISGLSGCYPESNNVYEFRDNLASKADMVTHDTRRWDSIHPEIPKRAGKIWNVEKCDAGFFGLHKRQCDSIDPLCRILLEKAFECLLDAGVTPKELEGSNTGVYVGACASESEKYWLYDNIKKDASAITGCHRSMLASRVSYALKLQGPAFVMDTACSSSFFAFEHAYRAIREGKCDRAIVMGANLCLHPYVTLQFSRLGVLSMDGACKCFDESANGYTRSEAICGILMQKSHEAKRVYCRLVHSKVNADGYKMQGITYPSGDTQKTLIREVYDECGLDPCDISFMEAHGTGTKVGDPEELKAIDEIFLVDRDRPLLIGSVKSNIGHTEPTSGLCSITKVILSMEGGKILPNMNFQTPRKGVKALENGKLVVVTDNVDWPDDKGLVGINSFGFGGANCHTIVQWHDKTKKLVENHKLPILILTSGRTKKSVQSILNYATKHLSDAEFIRLLHELTRDDISNFNCRGFQLHNLELNQSTEIKISWQSMVKKDLYFAFGNADSSWLQFSKSSLWNIPQFCSIINSMHQILLDDGIDLQESLKNPSDENQNLLTLFYQISIAKLIQYLNIKPVHIFGYFTGEITCAYLDGKLTLSQAVNQVKSQNYDFTQSGSKLWIKPPNWKTVPKNICLLGFPNCPQSKIKISENIFQVFGNLYLEGFNFDLHKLYPHVSWPVSRSTPMISPVVKWDHSRDWFVTKYRTQDIIKAGFVYTVVSLKDEYWKYLAGHVADGRNLFPGTAYLTLAWEVLGMITGKMTNSMKIKFENVRFLRATTIPNKGRLNWIVMVQRGSGYFEIIDGNTAIISGFINEILDQNPIEETKLPKPVLQDIKISQKEIYNELKLRGYQYKGVFKSLQDVDVSTNSGYVKWVGNWVSYLDAMLQMQILQIDSRQLYIPTGIKSLTIDPKYHLNIAESNDLIPIYAYKDLNVIRSGGIEMRGILANGITRRKAPEAVLEKYIFVPNETTLQYNLSETIRMILQISLENFSLSKLKIIEVLGDTDQLGNNQVATLIRDALEDLPLIEADIRVYTHQNLELPRISVESKSIAHETECYMIVGHNLETHFYEKVKSTLKAGGFVLNIDQNQSVDQVGYTSLLRHQTQEGFLTLYRLNRHLSEYHFVELIPDNFDFLDQLKTHKNCLLHATNLSGIIGLTNCLRKETSSSQTRCVLLLDPKMEFEPNQIVFKDQLAKNMAINVMQNNTWGTYRHLPINLDQKVLTNHCYANVTIRGDLSSLSWIQGAIDPKDHDQLVKVQYSAINFRDVMTASGRVSVDAITMNRLDQECVQGFEYSGIDRNGRKVMGMLTSGALATLIVPDTDMIAEIPSHWSLEESVTVPVVYCTILYAFFMRADGLQRGQSILIHSGSGGIGQAGISIALHFGCTVFTTVGSPEKRKFLLERFPKLLDGNIGNSRDTTFENLILKKTNGKGVDYVLNSLAEEKLQASIRCLAYDGHFFEIGKFDLASDNQLKCDVVNRRITFHGIMLDDLFRRGSQYKRTLMSLLDKGIRDGYVVPLNRTCFEMTQLEEAFRYMASGQHIGKIVLKITNSPNHQFRALPRYYCPSGKSCLVIGGLGGFGLELSDWLVIRGCKQLFITSRNGIKSGYQKLRIDTWRSYGCTVNILKEPMTTEDSCQNVLSMMPNLHAVFNLAVVLKDNLLEKQNAETFVEVLSAKAKTTQFLDKQSRISCKDLKHFIVFSSVSCGRGNIAQSNYGMANSVMERICERRRKDGYPALVIQWGSIADVGLAAELLDDHNERPIGGTLPQRISNCLEIMDGFLSQDECIVSSMVVAEKKGGFGSSDSMVDNIVSILGIRDLKTVSHHSTLPELGMDSMMAVEIKQSLERDYEVFLAPQEIRSLTFAQLYDIQNSKIKESDNKSETNKQVKYLFRLLEDEEVSKIPYIMLPNLGSSQSPKAFLIPGVEGFASILSTLASKLYFQTMGLQFSYDNPEGSLQEMAENLVQYIEPMEKFHVIAYSYGSTVAVELVMKLEKLGYTGTLILIDGSYDMMLKLTHQQTNTNSDAEFETSILCNILSVYMPIETTEYFKDDLLVMENFEDRINYVLTKSPTSRFSVDYIRKISIAIYKRIRAILDYVPTQHQIKSNVILFKPTIQSVSDLKDDYGLNKCTEKPVTVKVFDADHYNILDNEELAKDINEIVLPYTMVPKNQGFVDKQEEQIIIKNR